MRNADCGAGSTQNWQTIKSYETALVFAGISTYLLQNLLVVLLQKMDMPEKSPPFTLKPIAVPSLEVLLDATL